jgi:hypothetical protein
MKRLFCGLAVLALLLQAIGQSRSDFIYWNDFDDGHIRRANLDGSGQEILVSGLTTPGGLALDLTGGKMYWADRDLGDIRRGNLDATCFHCSMIILSPPPCISGTHGKSHRVAFPAAISASVSAADSSRKVRCKTPKLQLHSGTPRKVTCTSRAWAFPVRLMTTPPG